MILSPVGADMLTLLTLIACSEQIPVDSAIPDRTELEELVLTERVIIYASALEARERGEATYVPITAPEMGWQVVDIWGPLPEERDDISIYYDVIDGVLCGTGIRAEALSCDAALWEGFYLMEEVYVYSYEPAHP